SVEHSRRVTAMSFRFGCWLRGLWVRLSDKRPHVSGISVWHKEKRRRCGLRSVFEALEPHETGAQSTVARWQAQGVVVNQITTAFQASPVSDQVVCRPSRAARPDAPVSFAHPGNSDSHSVPARLINALSLAKVRAKLSSKDWRNF